MVLRHIITNIIHTVIIHSLISTHIIMPIHPKVLIQPQITIHQLLLIHFIILMHKHRPRTLLEVLHTLNMALYLPVIVHVNSLSINIELLLLLQNVLNLPQTPIRRHRTTFAIAFLPIINTIIQRILVYILVAKNANIVLTRVFGTLLKLALVLVL